MALCWAQKVPRDKQKFSSSSLYYYNLLPVCANGGTRGQRGSNDQSGSECLILWDGFNLMTWLVSRPSIEVINSTCSEQLLGTVLWLLNGVLTDMDDGDAVVRRKPNDVGQKRIILWWHFKKKSVFWHLRRLFWSIFLYIVAAIISYHKSGSRFRVWLIYQWPVTLYFLVHWKFFARKLRIKDIDRFYQFEIVLRGILRSLAGAFLLFFFFFFVTEFYFRFTLTPGWRFYFQKCIHIREYLRYIPGP